MKKEDFPSCCGAIIVHDMYGTSAAIRREINAYTSEAKMDRKGMVIAITSPRQETAIAVLKDTGFKAGKSFINPGTKRKLTVWTKTIGQPVVRKRAVAAPRW